MSDPTETVREVCAEYSKQNHTCRNCDFTVCPGINVFAGKVLAAHERELAAKDAEIALLKHILKSSCRWIKCHDIYHTSGDDILKEAKEILHDDGEFLFKKVEQ